MDIGIGTLPIVLVSEGFTGAVYSRWAELKESAAALPGPYHVDRLRVARRLLPGRGSSLRAQHRVLRFIPT